MKPPNTHTEEVRDLLQQIAQADEGAQARYFAEVFSLLMLHERFQKFVERNFIIEHSIDKETGILHVNVREAQPVIDKANEDFARAFSTTLTKNDNA